MRAPSRLLPSPCLAVALLLLPLLTVPLLGDEPGSELGSAPDSELTAEVAPQADPMRGLWTRHQGRGEGQPLRFWYFHGDGKGLYRYGKVGLAHTHSFDYAIDDGLLSLRFRKTGDEHRTRVIFGRDEQGRQWMRFADDPREAGARYVRVDSDLDGDQLHDGAWTDGARTDSEANAGLGDRIWIDYRNYATGGAGFHMYQLAAPAIDGRGVGWFHRGDFDDWSTESLTYRVDGDRLELFFDLREEPNVTGFTIVDGASGRSLELAEDPRDYWARHRYRDGGRSFSATSHAFDRIVGLEGLLAEVATVGVATTD